MIRIDHLTARVTKRLPACSVISVIGRGWCYDRAFNFKGETTLAPGRDWPSHDLKVSGTKLDQDELACLVHALLDEQESVMMHLEMQRVCEGSQA